MDQQEFFQRYSFSIRTDKIGGGAFGTVYKAYDNILNCDVAIKVSEVKIIGEKEFSLKDEFNAIKDLPPHPNIANYKELHSFEMPNGIFDYALMQFYKDGNLSHTIKNGLTDVQKEAVSIDLLKGIAHLHQYNIVHRDLKPGNILVVKRDQKIIPVITDFGLSKQTKFEGQSAFSNSFGGGTLKYSSPEQLKGEKLRLNTDLWAFGVIIYEIFTGKSLFNAEKSSGVTAEAEKEIYEKILNFKSDHLLDLIPPKWSRVIESCLVVDSNARVRNTEQLFDIISNKVQNDYSKTTIETKSIKQTAPIENPKKDDSDSQEINKKDAGTYVLNDKSQQKNQLKHPINDKKKGEIKQLISDFQNSSAKPKSRNRIIIIAAIFALVFISGFAFYLFQSSSEEKLEWDRVKSEETIDAYKEYLTLYPTGEHIEEAKETISWIETKSKSTKQDYIQFVKKYPKSEKAIIAKKEIEQIDYKNINTNNSTSIRRFITKYPGSKNTAELKARLQNLEADSISDIKNNQKDYDEYQLALLNNTKQSYSDYLRKYPNGKYRKQAKEKLKAIENIEYSKTLETNEWNRANRTATIASYNKYLQIYPNGKHAKEATREIESIKAAEAVTDVDKKEEEIVENEIFQVVEKMPTFPGGESAMYKFIASNLNYPNIAREEGIQGRVFLTFVVEKDGRIVDMYPYDQPHLAKKILSH